MGSAFPLCICANVGHYIRSGLAYDAAAHHSGKALSVATGKAGNNTIDYASVAQCAASWSSYQAFTSTDITRVPIVVTSFNTTTTELTYGANDVYTTRSGVPVASGSFTPTKVVQTVLNITSSTTTHLRTTQNPARFSASPTCSSVSPSDCSLLYVSYLQSLGLSSNASVPSITPAPSNSPHCPKYHYKTTTGCNYWNDYGGGLGTCYVSGANVQLFYFPSKTANASNGTSITTGPIVQSYAPGVTFTSPSIYLSFDYLSAMSEIGAKESACSSCGPNGCVTHAVGGGNAREYRGTSIAGALLSECNQSTSSRQRSILLTT